MKFLFDAPGDNADHPLVPARLEQGDAGALARIETVEREHGVGLHVGLDAAALAVEAVELLRDVHGAGDVVGDQAFDAERHVGQTACGVQARPQAEAHVESAGARRLTAGGAEQRTYPGAHLAGAHAGQALRHQNAVVAIERHHVGDGAERDQVEQARQIRPLAIVKGATCAQLGAQCQQGVEHHAHAGQRLARESAAGLIGIDDHVGLRQGVARQVVVGNQRGDAQRTGFFDAVDAGDAVIDGNDQVGFAVRGELDDGRGEAVAIFKTVRHQIGDVGAHRAQPAHGDRAGGGAVAVIVGHDQHARAGFDGIGEQNGGVADALQLRGRDELGQRIVQLAGGGDAARCVQPRQRRVKAVLGQSADGSGVCLAGHDARHE